MKVVQDLVAYFDKRGKLTPRQLKTFLDKNGIASDAPTNMHGLCDIVGATYYFRITGGTEGQVWGSGPYTRDSNLGAAAVHAGLLKPGQSGVLRITIVPPLPGYVGTISNGVTTSEYGEFPHAWQLSAL